MMQSAIPVVKKHVLWLVVAANGRGAFRVFKRADLEDFSDGSLSKKSIKLRPEIYLDEMSFPEQTLN